MTSRMTPSVVRIPMPVSHPIRSRINPRISTRLPPPSTSWAYVREYSGERNLRVHPVWCQFALDSAGAGLGVGGGHRLGLRRAPLAEEDAEDGQRPHGQELA